MAGRYEVERVSLSQVKESLAIHVVVDGRRRGGLQAGEGFCDPGGMTLDEGLDARLRQAQWGAHRQPAVGFDEDCDRFATRAYQPVNGDGHAAIVTESILNTL